jgi:tRNA pseudouridine38-40 synthase
VRQRRFKLTIEYDGTRYRGWQVQPSARTVQGELIAALEAATGTIAPRCVGAGRTDAGVHALGQVAHTDLITALSPSELCAAINEHLTHDIHVLSVEPVAHTFDARSSAVARSYLYQIALRRGAFIKDYAWWVRTQLDIPRMQKAGELLEGMHDFRSFARRDAATKSYRVLLEEVRIEQHEQLVLVRLTASHFLWHMVRAIVGVLVRVGSGQIGEQDVLRYLREDSPEPLAHAAPAAGLFLERVYYRGDRRGGELRPAVLLR